MSNLSNTLTSITFDRSAVYTDTKKIQNAYDSQGFVIIKGLITAELISEIMESVDSIFLNQYIKKFNSYSRIDDRMFKLYKEDNESFINASKVIQWLPSLHRLGLNAQIFQMLGILGIKTPTICTRPVLFHHHPELASTDTYHMTPPHRDYMTLQGSTNAVVVWLPLRELNEGMGYLHVIPGSHKRPIKFAGYKEGFAVEEGTQDTDYIQLPVDVEDTIFFNSLLVHKSGRNMTTRIRFSANFRYNDLSDDEWIKRNYYTPYTYKHDIKDPYIPKLGE